MTTPLPAESEPDDIRPPGYWGRHPLTKVVMFTAIGTGAFGPRVVDGDGGVLLAAGAGLVLMPMCMVAAIDHMRGLVSPLPGRDWKLLSPLAGLAWVGAGLTMSVLVILHVWLVGDGRPVWFVIGATVAGALGVAGVFIQIGSLSDQWPDKWRPPYAREVAGTEPGDGPADRTSDQA